VDEVATLHVRAFRPLDKAFRVRAERDRRDVVETTVVSVTRQESSGQ